MKRLFFYSLAVLMTLGLFMQSCKKDSPTLPTVATGEVQFTINQSDFGGLKDASDTIPECSELPWSYAKFTISGIEYSVPLVQMANGTFNTSAVQLDTGMYVLSSMYIYYDNGTAGDESDDILVRAAPLAGSKYYSLVTNTVEMDIHIQGFKKVGYIVDVLCYEELYYEYFGFVWFELNDIVIHQICVFGDVCTTDPDLYLGSLYEGQENGLQMDMPAIFHALIYKDGVLQSTFSNEEWLGEGECLPVHWADDVDLDEEFYLVIKTLLPVGTGFDYVTTDSIPIDPEDGSGLDLDDGVLIFAVGNCEGGPGIYQCNAWINLPATQYNFTITGLGSMYNVPYAPALLGSYFDYQFAGIPPGYAVSDGDWAGWCGQKNTTISVGQSYMAKFISSVQPLPAGFWLNEVQTQQFNWVFNHLNDYFPGIDLDALTDYGPGFEADDWRQIQWALWGISEGYDLNSAGLEQAKQIKDDALAQGIGFVPTDSQIGIVFVWMGNEIQLQLVTVHC